MNQFVKTFVSGCLQYSLYRQYHYHGLQFTVLSTSQHKHHTPHSCWTFDQAVVGVIPS